MMARWSSMHFQDACDVGLRQQCLGEMLEDFRHFRDPDTRRFMLFGPAAYWLLTALYNVFPLPRRQGFQRSFAHAGEAMDRGYTCSCSPKEHGRMRGSLHRSGLELACW